MNQSYQLIPQPSLCSLVPCPSGETSNACSFESVKPWFFKPRKSKYGLEDDHKKIKKYNSLHWTQEENRKYAHFLRGFLQLINGDTLQKRKYHLNRMLSRQIGSRSPVQCRSHHQKMMKVYKTPEAIIAHFDQLPEEDPISCHILESSAPQSEESASVPHHESSGTSAQNGQFLGEIKLKNYQESEVQCMEASLWDVLTYPAIDSNYNDL